MANVTLTFAAWGYDRIEPLQQGEVQVEGCEIVPVRMRSEMIFTRSLGREEFDITELSASSYLMQVGQNVSSFIAIPTFVSRAFRHRSIFIRNDRGIASPKDLEGKRVGVPEYQTTVALWLRGILQDEYDVDFRKIRYFTGGINNAGRRERLPLALPSEVDVTPVPATKTLSELLAEGELDAIFAPDPPDCFVQGHPHVVRMFDDYVAEERGYFGRTGFFPIMHVVAIRKEIVQRHPWLAGNLFRALVKAKGIAFKKLHEAAHRPANQFVLPWLLADLEQTEAAMGKNFWTYGFGANKRELETMCRYSHEQFLAPRRIGVEELFVPDTMDLIEGAAC